MLRYEMLFLTVPEITVDEASAIESQLEKAIAQVEGTILSYERWGKYNLAFPVRKYDYGVYFLIRFEVNDEQKTSLLASIRTLFDIKYIDLVMRYKIMRLDPHASLEYNRPPSLEDTPILEKNKMPGLLNKSHTSHISAEYDYDELTQPEQA
jgi:small subunit ribosomal protein S6